MHASPNLDETLLHGTLVDSLPPSKIQLDLMSQNVVVTEIFTFELSCVLAQLCIANSHLQCILLHVRCDPLGDVLGI